MKLGIGSYSYGWSVGVPGSPPRQPMKADDLLLHAARLGVSVVQIGDNLPLHAMNEQELERIGRLGADLGIAVEVGTRGFKPDIMLAYLELASRLGSPIMRIVPDLPDYKPVPEEIAAIARALMPEFARRGVVLAIENHDRLRVGELAQIVERVGSDHYGICLDTVNSMGAGEGLETIVETLGPLTVNLHVKDFVIERFDHLMGFTIKGTPAGSGMLNVPWLLETLRGYGRCGSAILELWTPPERELEQTVAKERRWVEESVAFLRRLLDRDEESAVKRTV